MGTDILIDLGISALITLLREKIPNSNSAKNKYKRALLKVFKAIAAAYQDDSEFKAVNLNRTS